MGLFYAIDLEDPPAPRPMADVIAGAVAGRSDHAAGSVAALGCEFDIRRRVDSRYADMIEEALGFRPATHVDIAIAKTLDEDFGPEIAGHDNAVRAALALFAAFAGDGALIFYGETPRLIKRRGRIYLCNPQGWTGERLALVPEEIRREPLVLRPEGL